MSRTRKILLLAALLGIGLFFVLRPSEPPPVASAILLDENYIFPPQKMSLFDRKVPRTPAWGWLWKTKEMIVGKRKSVWLEAAVLDVSDWNESWMTNLSLPSPALTATNGGRIWLLSEAEVASLRDRLINTNHAGILYVPRITTSDGGQARLTTGFSVPMWNPRLQMAVATDVGFSMDALPQIRGSVIDLFVRLRSTEINTNQAGIGSETTPPILLRTNIALAGRFQITNDSGIFLLDGKPADPDGKRMGIILSSKILKPGK